MKHMAILVLLASCGSDPSAKEADAVTTGSPSQAQPIAANPKPTVYSMAVTELPACAKENDRQLVWLKSESKFYACEAETWSQIDLPAPEAVAGAKGEKGDPGAKGEVSDPIPTNQWYDAMTETTWFLGGNVRKSEINTACTNGWHLPTKEELTPAVLHGLSQEVHARGTADTLWTSSVNEDEIPIAIRPNGAELVSHSFQEAGLVCLSLD